MLIRTFDENYFDSSYEITSDKGINFAFAITDFTSSTNITEDEDYGIMTARLRTWGIDDVG